MTNRAIFECQSTIEVPTKVLSLTYDSSNDASLGIQLANHDNGLTNEMFVPGYASVGKSSHTLNTNSILLGGDGCDLAFLLVVMSC
jgi:hypothetical protein